MRKLLVEIGVGVPRTASDLRDPGELAGSGAWIVTGRLYPQFLPHLGDGNWKSWCGVRLCKMIGMRERRGCPVERRIICGALRCAGWDAFAAGLFAPGEFAEATLHGCCKMSTTMGGKARRFAAGRSVFNLGAQLNHGFSDSPRIINQYKSPGFHPAGI